MKEISVAEFQSDVVSWIKQAAIEKQIVIIDQGRPVAALIPFLLSKLAKSLPNREEHIRQRSWISIDSSSYISEMRD